MRITIFCQYVPGLVMHTVMFCQYFPGIAMQNIMSTVSRHINAQYDPLSIISRHRYGAPGTYNVTVTCANNVSSSSAQTEVKVQEVITNLRMLNEGASKGQPFYLEWLWDSGTDITFTVTFDGQSIQSR